MSAYNVKFRYCNCGNPLQMLEHDNDRAWYARQCPECEAASVQRIEGIKSQLQYLDETECFRVMSLLLTRIESVRKVAEFKRSGYGKN